MRSPAYQDSMERYSMEYLSTTCTLVIYFLNRWNGWPLPKWWWHFVVIDSDSDGDGCGGVVTDDRLWITINQTFLSLHRNVTLLRDHIALHEELSTTWFFSTFVWMIREVRRLLCCFQDLTFIYILVQQSISHENLNVWVRSWWWRRCLTKDFVPTPKHYWCIGARKWRT